MYIELCCVGFGGRSRNHRGDICSAEYVTNPFPSDLLVLAKFRPEMNVFAAKCLHVIESSPKMS
jgi:hypothetical protein